MRTAAEMNKYFVSIGFTLVKGCFNTYGKGGWTLGPTQFFSTQKEDGYWRYSIHFPSLREVERGWGCKVASLLTDMDVMRKLLMMYKTASTHELEAIADWAENLRRNGGGTRCEFESPNVPVWLSTQMKNETFWCFGWALDFLEGYSSPVLPPGWKKKAKKLYSRFYTKDCSYKKRTLRQRIVWLCRRACKERLRALPQAQVETVMPKRL